MSETLSLKPDEHGLTFFPKVGDTETLYSICARIHHRRGSRSSEVTSEWMFGFKTAAGLKGLPRGLTQFCTVTGKRLGSPQTILRSRTPFGIYLPLLSDPDAQKILDWACGSPSERAPVMPLRAFKSKTDFPLRACQKCLEADSRVLGTGTWRVEHQLPGMFVCPWHGEQLLEQIFAGKRRQENKWHMTHDSELAFSSAGDTFAAHSIWWLNYAKVAWVLFSHKKVSPPRLRAVLGQGLAHQGVVPTTFRFDRGRIEDWWKQVKRPDFAQVRGMEALSSSKWLADLQLGRLSNHPVRWAVAFTASMSPEALSSRLDNAPSHQGDFDGSWMPTGDERLDMLSPVVWEMLSAGHDIIAVSAYSGKAPQVLRHALRMNPSMLRSRAATVRKIQLAAKRAMVQDFFIRNPRTGRVGLVGCLPAELRWLEAHDATWIAHQLRFGERTRSPQRTLFP